MTTTRIILLAAPIFGFGLALAAARAQQADVSRTARPPGPAAGGAHGAPPRETITVAGDEPIPNVPGKRLVSHVVDYPPGGGSAPHRHARSAFVYAYVISGQIRSQVDDGPARVFKAGETWFESPGAHHRVSENASDTEPARLLAVVIVDAADKQVTIPDPR
jgi:quercetin dioxygenase-like cupin family protein